MVKQTGVWGEDISLNRKQDLLESVWTWWETHLGGGGDPLPRMSHEVKTPKNRKLVCVCPAVGEEGLMKRGQLQEPAEGQKGSREQKVSETFP